MNRDFLGFLISLGGVWGDINHIFVGQGGMRHVQSKLLLFLLPVGHAFFLSRLDTYITTVNSIYITFLA